MFLCYLSSQSELRNECIDSGCRVGHFWQIQHPFQAEIKSAEFYIDQWCLFPPLFLNKIEFIPIYFIFILQAIKHSFFITFLFVIYSYVYCQSVSIEARFKWSLKTSRDRCLGSVNTPLQLLRKRIASLIIFIGYHLLLLE